MSNRVFIISDTHFGHSKILEFEADARKFDSIEQHNETLVNNWNRVVTKNDTVWHLGDVLFGKDSFAYLPRLNGVKKLVLGNHDHYPMADYLRHFNSVYGCVKYRDCLLSHVPIHPSQKYRFLHNIHGHMHSAKLDDPFYINVSCEQIGLAPKLLDTVLAEAAIRISAPSDAQA